MTKNSRLFRVNKSKAISFNDISISVRREPVLLSDLPEKGDIIIMPSKEEIIRDYSSRVGNPIYGGHDIYLLVKALTVDCKIVTRYLLPSMFYKVVKSDGEIKQSSGTASDQWKKFSTTIGAMESLAGKRILVSDRPLYSCTKRLMSGEVVEGQAILFELNFI